VLREVGFDEGHQTFALVSLIISSLSAGFTSATITYDYDTGVQRRRDEPEMYGMVPRGQRGTFAFVAMVINSAILLLLKGIGVSLALDFVPWPFLAWVVVDWCGYIAQRSLRRDLVSYWNVGGGSAIFFDAGALVLYKLIVDSTGVVQFRVPGILGGVYWSFSVIASTLTTPILCVVVATMEGSPDDFIFKTVACLGATWVATALLMYTMFDRRYRHTFTSTETCSEWVRGLFVHGELESRRMKIHTKRRRLWLSIRGDVKTWTLERWGDFEAQQPSWFDDGLIGQVDRDMIPPYFLKRMQSGLRINDKRRKSSIIAAVLDGGMRGNAVVSQDQNSE
jgi:hypothetical protein